MKRGCNEIFSFPLACPIEYGEDCADRKACEIGEFCR